MYSDDEASASHTHTTADHGDETMTTATTTKISTRDVMLRAWELRRQHDDNLFSECLRQAWAEARGEQVPAKKTWKLVGRDTYTYRADIKHAGFKARRNRHGEFAGWYGDDDAKEWMEEIIEEYAGEGRYRPKLQFVEVN